MVGLRQVSEHCWVATSSFCQLNTVVVSSEGSAVVIDPGVTGAELDELVAALHCLGVKPQVGLSTHPHWDHLLWHPGLGRVPRLAGVRAVEWLDDRRLAEARAEAAPEASGADLELLGLIEPIDATGLRWSGPQLTLIGHDGHAPGHLAISVPDDGVLIAGDMCSDVEIPLLDLTAEQPLDGYRTGLAELRRAAGGCHLVVPGHGTIARDEQVTRRFDQDLAYLDALEAGEQVGDVRLDEAVARGTEWLLEEHARQLSWARSAGAGRTPGKVE